MHSFIQLFTAPRAAWSALAAQEASLPRTLAHMALLALVPAVAWYYGVTEIGWRIGGDGAATRMTGDTAIVIIVLFYGAMLAGLVAIGMLLHWMSDTYGAESTPARAIRLVTWTATPLLAIGVVGVYPVLWFDLLVGTAVAGWTFYLLLLGMPPMLGIPFERAQLFASAVLAVGLVLFIGLMGATVILWEFGAMPEFTD